MHNDFYFKLMKDTHIFLKDDVCCFELCYSYGKCPKKISFHHETGDYELQLIPDSKLYSKNPGGLLVNPIFKFNKDKILFIKNYSGHFVQAAIEYLDVPKPEIIIISQKKTKSSTRCCECCTLEIQGTVVETLFQINYKRYNSGNYYPKVRPEFLLVKLRHCEKCAKGNYNEVSI